jgi:hypothetical protein
VSGPPNRLEDCEVCSEVQVFVPVNIGLLTNTDLRKRWQLAGMLAHAWPGTRRPPRRRAPRPAAAWAKLAGHATKRYAVGAPAGAGQLGTGQERGDRWAIVGPASAPPSQQIELGGGYRNDATGLLGMAAVAATGVFTAAAGGRRAAACSVRMARYQPVRIAQPMCHGLLVVAVGELGMLVAVVVSGTVPAGAVVVAAAAGVVVVGTANGAVVGADPDGEVVDVPGGRVAGEADLSAPATTTPTEVLAACRGRLPTKLASGCWATASTPVITPTAIPNAAIAATAARRQRSGWGCTVPAPSSLASALWPTRRSSERRARVWADASERVYRASPEATTTLPSAAPMRVPSTPKKEATTAAVIAASAPASNLGTRSCSIPHLQVGVGRRRHCRVGARRHLQEPASYRRGPSGAIPPRPSRPTAQPALAALRATRA